MSCRYSRFRRRGAPVAMCFIYIAATCIALIFHPDFLLKASAAEKTNLFSPYPLVDERLQEYKDAPLDENGVLLVRYGDTLHYNPTSIAFYALRHYTHHYVTGSHDSLEKFLRHAHWLRENLSEKSNGTVFGVWEYEFSYPDYQPDPGWVSALSQGLGASVMVKAWRATGNREFLKVAKLAINAFEVPISKGGVASHWPDGSVWYEQYPGDPGSHVLNGFMFALAGIHDYSKATGDAKAKALFNAGVASARKHLGEYDIGFASLYDVKSRGIAPAGIYHRFHIQQLLWLHYVTGDLFFYEYARKWLNYDKGFVKRVSVSSSIEPENHGPRNLNDGRKYYGNWSSNKLPATIVLDMGEAVDNIEAIVFYATSRDASPAHFSVSVSNSMRQWSRALSVNGTKPQITGYNRTGVYATSINGYIIHRLPGARYVKITINGVNKGEIAALREVEVHFDQTKNANREYKGLVGYFDPNRPEPEDQMPVIPTQTPSAFNDVPRDAWYRPYVSELTEEEIIGGYPDGNFRPLEHVTRAEFAKMAVLATGEAPSSAPSSFMDVPDRYWGKGYIQKARELGIMRGYPDGTFKPMDRIARQEIAVAAIRTGEHLPTVSFYPYFIDVAPTLWSWPYIIRAKELAIMGGYPDATFHPFDTINRAETAKVIWALMQR